jgi:glycine dehydrogenase subunit 1
MSYLHHTDAEREAMLRAIGVGNIDDLFRDVPEELRLKELDIPPGLSQPEVRRLLTALAAQNVNLEERPSFLGGGAYRSYVPAAVDAITSRAEFYTSYTPYQPELSQGTLQVIYEFQSMIALLTELDVSNASLYDGATAVAEAVNIARGATGRNRIAILNTVNPEYRRVLRTYADGAGYAIDEISALPTLDLDTVRTALTDQHAALIAQNPDFVGLVNPMAELVDTIHAIGGLFIAVVDPISLGLLAAPGEYGADIAVGEGQSLGNWLNYGGPYLGFMAARSEFQRRIPGRIAGATVDNRGQRAYVQTREQHIRREKATSNICTNEALAALAATVYLALMGKEGLRAVANLSLQKAHYAAREISRLPGYRLAFDAPFFREFALATPVPAAEVNRFLLSRNIIGGLDLGPFYPEMPEMANTLLLAFTELTTRAEIDDLVRALAELMPAREECVSIVAGGVR